jgi:hypothetical protein
MCFTPLVVCSVALVVITWSVVGRFSNAMVSMVPVAVLGVIVGSILSLVWCIVYLKRYPDESRSLLVSIVFGIICLAVSLTIPAVT